MTFSPDNRWIGFVDGSNTIWKVPIDGGRPVEILRSPIPTGSLAWSDDDTIAFTTLDPSTGILRVSANGGDVEVLTRPDTTKWIDHTAIGPSVDARALCHRSKQREQDIAAWITRTGRYRTCCVEACRSTSRQSTDRRGAASS
jgi:hypothetical protein